MDHKFEAEQLRREWDSEDRWDGIKRGYEAEDVGSPYRACAEE